MWLVSGGSLKPNTSYDNSQCQATFYNYKQSHKSLLKIGVTKTLHIQLLFSSDFKVSAVKLITFKLAIWNDKHSQVEFDLCGLKFKSINQGGFFQKMQSILRKIL